MRADAIYATTTSKVACSQPTNHPPPGAVIAAQEVVDIAKQQLQNTTPMNPQNKQMQPQVFLSLILNIYG